MSRFCPVVCTLTNAESEKRDVESEEYESVEKWDRHRAQSGYDQGTVVQLQGVRAGQVREEPHYQSTCQITCQVTREQIKTKLV